MASLKEIKNRISSITSTQKITAAMKMVASAKLHHTQTATERTLAYSEQLAGILQRLLAAEADMASPYTESREVRNVAMVVCSSNTGLCGSFNSNVWKETEKLIETYKEQQLHIVFYPVGKKIAKELSKAGYAYEEAFVSLAEHLSYEAAAQLSARLQADFLNGKVDRVELLYHHYKNMIQQILTHKQYLPLSIEVGQQSTTGYAPDYILEPSASALQALLYPKMLNLQIYTTLLDTTTAEHAARMMAMQTANDNANGLIQDLTLLYNKTRQQAITNELLDIMGGAER